MFNSLKLLIFFWLMILNSYAFAIELSEDSLKALAAKGLVPQLDQIESSFLMSSVKEGETKEQYSSEIFARGSYGETHERAIIEFQPIFSPYRQVQLGVRKNFSAGIDTSVYLATDSRSTSSPFIGKIQNATTTQLALTAQIDLWKNIFGKISRAQIQSVDMEKKKAFLEKEIQTKTFFVSLRRLYWSLVANQESMLISEELLKTAQKQLIEAKNRLKNAVAEADEVARYEAQLASRQGTLLYLKYQKENLIKQLRLLLPDLSNQDIELGKYDLNKTVQEVLTCTALISTRLDTPYDYTQYDEVISLLKNIKYQAAVVNSRYAGPDVKLFGTIRSTGVASDKVRDGFSRGSFGDSIDDQTEQNRTGYEVGVNFSLPLENVKEETQRVKELYDEKRLMAMITSTESQVVSTHEQLTKTINLLTQVIKAQQVSSEQLSKRLKLMQKKYQQARVSVDDLVFDQDALLNAQLMTIDTKRQILGTLFDYILIFNQTPCSFNRI